MLVIRMGRNRIVPAALVSGLATRTVLASSGSAVSLPRVPTIASEMRRAVSKSSRPSPMNEVYWRPKKCEVQQKLLPRSAPQVPGIDVAGFSRYCDETGGAYYD